MEAEQRVNPKSVFLVLGFTSGDTPSRIEQILTQYFRGRGFEVRTGRELRAGEKIDEGLKRIIGECGFGVVVYNELRHNISYEWGILDALGKTVVPLANRNAYMTSLLRDVISDKAGTIIVFYSGDKEKGDIIQEIEESPSLTNAIERIGREIAERISPEEPELAKEVAKAIAESSLPLGGIEEKREVPNASQIADALEAIRQLTAEGHFYRATAYYYADRLPEAEAQLREALRIDPNLAEAHFNLGLLLQKLDKDSEAEAEYREALTINPNDDEAHNNLGNLLVKLGGRDKEAEAEYREALRINPDDAAVHNNLGVLLKKLDRDDEAEAEYREALRINANDAAAHNNLGVLLEKLDRDSEAEAEYREVLRIDPSYAEARGNLGILLHESGRSREARSELKIAIRLFQKQGRDEYVNKAKEILKGFDEK